MALMPFVAVASIAIVQLRPESDAGSLERWVAIISGIAMIVIAVALIAIFLGIVSLALSARRAQRRMGSLFENLQAQAQPMMAHAQSVADNVDFVSTAIRSDVERLKQTVDLAQERLERAADATEERISRFNSLLEMVQDEAESLFISTASTLHGMKAGARRLREPSPDLAWEDDEDDDDLQAEQTERSRRQL